MTSPDPQDPDQLPPVNEIQFLCPNGVGPTETRGSSVTDILKSRLRLTQDSQLAVMLCNDTVIEVGHTLGVEVIEKDGGMMILASMDSKVWVS